MTTEDKKSLKIVDTYTDLSLSKKALSAETAKNGMFFTASPKGP